MEHGAQGGVAAFARGLLSSRDCLLTMAAIALANLAVLLMNRSLFPLFDAVFTYARDISVTCSGLACITVGLVSLVRPAWLHGRALETGALVALLAGAALTAAGLAWSNPAVLVAGAVLFIPARGWALLTANLAAMRLATPQAVACIACGVAAGQLAEIPFRFVLPGWAALAALLVAAAGSLLLSARPAVQAADAIAQAEPVADTAVTRPASFVSLVSPFYMCLVLVQAAFGFALRFGEVGGSPSFGSLSALFAVALAALVVALRGRFFADAVSDVTMLALVAGFLLVLVGGFTSVRLATGLLTAGTALFGVLMYTVLVALAGRNRLASLTIMGWGVGLSSLATTFGALLGTTANRLDAAGDAHALSLLVAAVVFAIVAYILFGLRGFSFKATVEGVEDPAQTAAPAIAESGAAAPDLKELSEELFANRCSQIAQRYGLTPREGQTFAMLARGRDRAYIEERLGVSRNTVKAHVKHVYAKLGIHSHQELIDLIDVQDAPRA